MRKRNFYFHIISLLFLTSLVASPLFSQEEDLSRFHDALTNNRNGGCGFFTGTTSSVRPNCNGGNDGQACITISGGIGPFAYFWLGAPSVTNCRLNVGAGTYTVIVTDLGQSSVQCAFDVPVTEPAAIGVFTMNPVPPTCFGLCDGSANPIVTGGTGQKSFLYSSGETTQLATMLCNPFSLTITDANGCTADTTFTYANGPTPISIAGLATDQQCAGVNDGTINITVTGGTNSYGFQWTGPSSFTSISEDLTGLAPGVYDLTVTDSNGCTQTASFQIFPTTPMTSAATIVHIVCAGDATGAIDITPAGGAGSYSYLWSGPNSFSAITQDLVNVFAGNYIVAITDANLCTLNFNYTINQDVPILITGAVTDLTCFGDPTGAIALTVTGTHPVQSYAWTGPNSYTASTPDITGLYEGFYTVVVTNTVGCVVDSTFEVTTPPIIQLTAAIDNLACAGDSDGSIDLEVSGGNGTYGYAWTGPASFTASTQDISGLSAGAYTVVVTDGLLCSVDSTFNITEPLPITVDPTITPVLCNGNATGSIAILISGGTSPYTINWTGPSSFTSSDEDIFNLIAGPYVLDLTDFNGCLFSATYTVDQPTPVVITGAITHVLCNGSATGVIDITVSGGMPTYNCTWIGPNGFTSSSLSLSGLLAGSYAVTCTDGNGCVMMETFVLNEPAALELNETHTNITCFGANDGSIDLTITGGTGTPIIAWTSLLGFTSSSEDLSNLGPDTYTVTVTDTNACVTTLDVIITEPLGMNIVGSVTHVACFGGNTGAVNVTVSNGMPNYLYSWTGPGGFTSVSEDITGLIAGTYIVTITDDNGCVRTASFTVLQNQPILAPAIITDVICNGAATGAIDITASGGQTAYQYSWTGPGGFTSTSADITALMSGSYVLTITDALLCDATFNYTVNGAVALNITALSSDPDCADDANGSIDITVTGGTGLGTYTYSWSGPLGFIGIMEDLVNREGGTYIVTATDANGCTIQGTYTLAQPTEIQVTLTLLEPSCDTPDGTATAAVTGGTVAADYDYQWFDSNNVLLSTTNTAINLGAGSYLLIVTDDSGCTNNQFFTLSDVTGSLTAVITNVNCLGDNDGAINLNINGLTPPYIITWTGPVSFSSSQEDISGLIAGAYTVTVDDSLGCTLVEIFTVGAPPPININAVITHQSCSGANDGSINLSATGGFGMLNYVWTGPGTFSAITQDLTDLAPGTYELVVSDTQGCTVNGSFTVNPAVNYTLTANITDILCNGQSNGAIDLMVNPNINNETYAWTGPNGFTAITQDISGLIAGTYDVTLTTSNLCSFTDSFTVDSPDPISVIADLTPSACGSSIGAVTLTVTGGTVATDYVYSIITLPGNTPISSTNSASNLDGGLYGYTVTDDNGCVFTSSFVINDSVGTLTAVVTNETCQNANDGAIDITVSGLTGTLTAQWAGPNGFSATSQDITGLAEGTYSVSITDANGCVLGDSYQVLPAAGIIVTGAVVNSACLGSNNGSINMSHTGGVAKFTFAWTGPGSFTAISEDLSDLQPGVYTVTVTDGTGCEGTQTFTVTEPLAITVVPTITGVLCNGGNTGAITITTAGGNGGYIYSWTGPGSFVSSFGDVSDLIAGTYILTVTDIRGCTFTASYIVPQSSPIVITLVLLTPANCNLSNGSIQVSASGGNPNYGYVWTNSTLVVVGSSATASNLPVGSYTVQVSDQDGCIQTDQYIVSSIEATLSVSITEVSCFGFSDGAIDLTVAGTLTGPVDTLWTGPGAFMETTEDISGLIAGDYTITLSDSIGCVISEVYTVLEPDEIIVNVIISHVLCNGGSSGSITPSTSGGTGTLTPSWTGPGTFTASTLTITGLLAGTYILTLTDQKRCVSVNSYDVNEPIGITATAVITDVLCFADSTGAIDLTTAGGIGTLEYAWTGPGTFSAITQDISGLIAGDYQVIITDQNNCSKTFTYTLDQNPQIVISLVNLNPATCGISNGSIEVSAAGGDDTLSFEWFDAGMISQGTGNFIDGLAVGIYTVIVTDGLACDEMMSYEIVNENVSLAAIVTDVSCFGVDDGAIDLSVIGTLLGPVDTLWTGPGSFSSTLGDIDNLFAGIYTVTVSDSVGCVLTEEYEILEPALLTADGLITPTLCNADSTGDIISNVAGGTEAYGYAWTGPNGFTSAEPDISNLVAGIYNLTVTDDHGCTALFEGEVLQPDALSALETLTDPSCIGNEDGSILLDVIGGTGTPTYVWNGPNPFTSTLEDIADLGPGIYDVLITDQNGCQQEESYQLFSLQVLAITAVSEDINCFEEANGSIDLEVNGGTLTYDYAWTGPGIFSETTQDISGLLAGTYAVLITDATGCEHDTTIVLTQPEVLAAENILPESLNCNGDNSGSIFLDLIGGTQSYTLAWTGPGTFTSDQEDITGLGAGDYTLNVTDAQGCFIDLPFTLDEPTAISIVSTNITDAICENSPDGSIDLDISEGNPGYASSWIGPGNFTSVDEDLDGILAGIYTITVTDNNGCVAEASFTVGYQLEILADAGDYPPICNGETIQLDGSNSEGAQDYSWSLQGGPVFSSQVSPTLQASTSSNVVILTITNGFCIDRDTLDLDILLLPIVDAGSDATTFVGDTISLGGNPTSTDAASYTWFPNESLDDPSLPNPVFTNLGTTTFTVTVIGNNGCIASDMVTITLNPSVTIPTGFTPNGDQVNDNWVMGNRSLFPEMTVQVFSRWGDELFSSPPGYPEPWNGEYKNSPLPVGTYYYVINLSDPMFPEVITGPLTIFR